MIEVVNHWLEWDSPHVTLTKKLERISSIITPEILVIHYGVANTLASLVGAQRATGYWAQLTIDGFVSGAHGTTYQVYQSMPFNMRGSHAGESSYKGRTGCNAFSIGVEIANPGPLIRCKDGKLRTDANAKAFWQGRLNAPTWPEDDAVKAQHPQGPRRLPWCSWDYWAAYPDQEIDIVIGIGQSLSRS